MCSKLKAAAFIPAALYLASATAQTYAALSFNVGGTWDTDARRTAASNAIQAVVNRHNAYGDFGNYNIYVYYNAGIPTAQASYQGSIGFGGTYPNERVTQHESNHYLGSGTTTAWNNRFTNNVWTGAKTNALAAQFDGDGTKINKSGVHFYGYGLNYDNEVINSSVLMRNVAIMYAMRQDTGLGVAADPWSATNVALTQSDAIGTSAFNYFGAWNDNYFAHANAAYTTGAFTMRTPLDTYNAGAATPSFTFAGESLTVNTGGVLLYKGVGTTGLLTFKNLILDGGSARHASGAGDLFRIAGKVTVNSASSVAADQGDVSISANVGGSGTLTKTGGYNLTLSGNNTFTGALVVGANAATGNFGAVRLASPNAASAAASITVPANNGATAVLQLDGSAGNMTVPAALAISARNSTTSVSIQNVAGNNTLSGPVMLGVGGVGYAIQSDAGTLTLSNAAGLVANGTRTLTLIGSGNGAINGPIADGTGKFTVAKTGTGTWTFTGANTYTGTTTVGGGTLRLGDGTAGRDGTLAAASAVSLAGGSTLVFNRFADNSAGFSIGGAGAVTKLGPGTQTLTGNNTYTGATTVAAGTLRATPAAYATLLTNAGGTDIVEGGATLVLDYAGAASPVGTVKSLLTASYAGNFATGKIRSTTLAPGHTVGYGDDGLGAVTVRITLPGDADLDGDVDFNDFLALQTSFGNADTRFDQGNFNYDAATDFNDFLTLQTNFGQSVGFGPVAFTGEQVAAMTAFGLTNAVPEPATLGVLMAAAVGLTARRRRA